MKNKLKNQRENLGLTQLEVAKKTNITVRNYQRIEKKEQDPKTTTSLMIAKSLNSTVEELFNYLLEQEN